VAMRAVACAQPPVSSESAVRDEPNLRAEWLQVLHDNDIDLVLMGHDHTYARGYVNTDATETPGITTGPVYVVSNSGAKHYDLESDEKNVWTNNGATQVLRGAGDRKSTRLNSSHVKISYAVFCLKKKKKTNIYRLATT